MSVPCAGYIRTKCRLRSNSEFTWEKMSSIKRSSLLFSLSVLNVGVCPREYRPTTRFRLERVVNACARSFRLSKDRIPTRVNVSAIRLDLMLMSNGESVFMLGLRLTSISHGCRSESISTSNPYSSKQFELLSPSFVTDSTTVLSIDIMVFITKS